MGMKTSDIAGMSDEELAGRTNDLWVAVFLEGKTDNRHERALAECLLERCRRRRRKQSAPQTL